MLLCTDCGSRSVVIEMSLREGAAITCADCGQWQGHYPEFFTDMAKGDSEKTRDVDAMPDPAGVAPVLVDLTSPLTRRAAG